jgi:hypothetical protein
MPNSGQTSSKYVDIVVDEALKQSAKEFLVQNPKAKYWAFLNSPFGLFLLSSVVLGLLSFAYGGFTRSLERRRAADKLELEIALRFKDFAKIATGGETERYSTVLNLGRIDDGETTKFYIRKPAFTEFNNARTASLLWQLSLLVHGAEKDEVLARAKDALHIDDLLIQVEYDAAKDVPDDPPGISQQEKARLGELHDHLTKDFGQKELFQLAERQGEGQVWKVPK